MAHAFKRARKPAYDLARAAAVRLFRLDEEGSALGWGTWDATAAMNAVRQEIATRWMGVKVEPVKALKVNPHRADAGAARGGGSMYARALEVAAPKAAPGEYRLRVRAWVPGRDEEGKMHQGCGHAAMQVVDAEGKAMATMSFWPKWPCPLALLAPMPASLHSHESDIKSEDRAADQAIDIKVDAATAARAIAAINQMEKDIEAGRVYYGLMCNLLGVTDLVARVVPGRASAAELGADPFSGSGDPIVLEGRAAEAGRPACEAHSCASAVARVLNEAGLPVGHGSKLLPFAFFPADVVDGATEAAARLGLKAEDATGADKPEVAAILAALRTTEAADAAADDAACDAGCERAF